MVRGLEVRRPFVDYFRSVNSPRVVDQVTKDQFVGGLTQLGLDASGVEVALLAARFAGEPGFVNFNSFACAVDPALNTFSAREPRSDLMEGAVFQSGFRAPTVLGLGPGQPGRPPTGSDFPRLPREASSSEVEGLIRRMQDKALQYRVRVGEALKDFDKHHDGTVTQPQFAQALWQTFGPLHLSLTEAERAMLVDKYATLMGHGAVHVNWRAFVKDVEAVFTGDGPQLERSPTGKPAQRYLEHPPVSLEAADEAAVQALLRDIKRRVEVRRALVKPMFADYEKQVNSAKAVDHVTRSQMVQALSRLGIDLPVEHQRLLHARYDTHANGLVNYVALVRDIDPLEAFSNRKNTHHVFPQDADFGRVSNGAPPGGFFKSKVSSGSPQPGRPAPRNEGVTGHLDLGGLEAVLSRLADAAKANRLKTDLAFKEFDMASRNQLTTPQFVRVVDMLFGKFVTLSQDDTASLVAAFATPLKGGGVGVAWKDFVAAVDGMPPPAKGVRLPSLSPTEESLAAECCARLRHVAYTRRLLIRPFFTDMEKARRAMNHVDHVTRSQFAECLSSLGLQCSAAELEALNRKFDDKADGWVNFVAFQVAIDPEQAVFLARDGRGNPDDTRRYAETGGWRTTNTVVAGQPGRPPVVAEFARLNLCACPPPPPLLVRPATIPSQTADRCSPNHRTTRVYVGVGGVVVCRSCRVRVCVGVGGVVLCRCVCVCDLLIFLQDQAVGRLARRAAGAAALALRDVPDRAGRLLLRLRPAQPRPGLASPAAPGAQLGPRRGLHQGGPLVGRGVGARARLQQDHQRRRPGRRLPLLGPRGERRAKPRVRPQLGPAAAARRDAAAAPAGRGRGGRAARAAQGAARALRHAPDLCQGALHRLRKVDQLANGGCARDARPVRQGARAPRRDALVRAGGAPHAQVRRPGRRHGQLRGLLRSRRELQVGLGRPPPRGV